MSRLAPDFLTVEIRARPQPAQHDFQLIHAVCSNARMYSMTDSDQPSMCPLAVFAIIVVALSVRPATEFVVGLHALIRPNAGGEACEFHGVSSWRG